MGLDQYAYAQNKNGEDEHLVDWRKHNRLQGWMEDLWNDKGRPNAETDDNPMGDFNCVPLELDSDDIDRLEADINDFNLPETNGFFFGSDSYFWSDENGEPLPENDYYYKELDLQFIADARKALDDGKKVFYSCWYQCLTFKRNLSYLIT